MPVLKTELIRYFSSVCVLTFFSLALVIESGYSYGAALLFLAGLALLFYPPGWPTLNKADSLLLAALSVFALTWMAEVAFTGQETRALDKASRFILSGIVLLFLLRFPPSGHFFWAGLAVGAMGAGGIAIWQKLIEGAERASGHMALIEFGNISMLMGLLCFCGLAWATGQKHGRVWMLLLLSGFAMGFLGSMLSGTRGGWIGLPFIFLFILKAHADQVSRNTLLMVLGPLLVLPVLVYLIPATGVSHRVGLIFSDLWLYFDDNVRNTSLGLRLEMWKGALSMFAERPLAGWGTEGYQARMQAYVNAGYVIPQVMMFDHAHNEWLDIAAKRGVPGVLSLLLLYGVPMILLYRILSGCEFWQRSYPVAGIVLVLSCIDFGLSNVFFNRNAGVMFFTFVLIMIWSLCRHNTEPSLQRVSS